MVGSFELLMGIFISSGLLVLLPGFYMVFSKGDWTPWVILGLILWFAHAMFGNIVIGKKIMGVIKPLKETEGPLSSDSLNIIRGPFIHKSLIARLTIALGVVFIMMEKPGMAGTLIALSAAAFIGLAIAIPAKKKELSSAAVEE